MPSPRDRRLTAASLEARRRRLWELYRLMPDDWDAIVDYQGGVCAITGRLPGTVALNTDHDHETGLIRGLLHPWVNKGLVYFDDNPTFLRRAADYLENPPAVAALGRKVYGLLGKARRKKKMVYGPLPD